MGVHYSATLFAELTTLLQHILAHLVHTAVSLPPQVCGPALPHVGLVIPGPQVCKEAGY